MPTKPLHECSGPGCRRLTDRRFCDECRPAYWRATDARRGTSAERGYDHTWQKLTKALACHPDYALCVRCNERGIVRAREVFDHIVPLSAGGARLDPANIQPLCVSCHSAKTVTEDGGFGNRRRVNHQLDGGKYRARG